MQIESNSFVIAKVPAKSHDHDSLSSRIVDMVFRRNMHSRRTRVCLVFESTLAIADLSVGSQDYYISSHSYDCRWRTF